MKSSIWVLGGTYFQICTSYCLYQTSPRHRVRVFRERLRGLISPCSGSAREEHTSTEDAHSSREVTSSRLITPSGVGEPPGTRSGSEPGIRMHAWNSSVPRHFARAAEPGAGIWFSYQKKTLITSAGLFKSGPAFTPRLTMHEDHKIPKLP